MRLSVWPTLRGWQAIFFGTLTFVVARLIGTTQIYQLAYALLGLLLCALALGFFFSRSLSYARQLPAGERLIAGRPSAIELAFSNASRRRSPSAKVIDHLPERRVFRAPPVEGVKTRRVREGILFPKRGRYALGPAELQTTDPFGLWRFTRKPGERPEVTVYPQVFDLDDFTAWGRGREAGARDAFASRGDEFSNLREYRHGDDRRHIHWKSVARSGELMVKEFVHDAPRRHAVVLDLHGLKVSEAEVEDAVSAAGSVLGHLTREGLPFRLFCTNQDRNETGFGGGEDAYWQAMDLLAMARADGNARLAGFLAERPRAELGEGVVLVCRSLGEDLARSVRDLRAAGLSVVVMAIATYTYRVDSGAVARGPEAAFWRNVRRLEEAGARDVRVVRRGSADGVAALAGEAFVGGGRG